MKRRTFLHAVSAASIVLAGSATHRMLNPERTPLSAPSIARPDVYLDLDQYSAFTATYERMQRLQLLVGHGNYNVLGFDDARRFARHYDSVGAFTDAETGVLEQLFYADASAYGFLGHRISTRLTEEIPEKDKFKVGKSGHYLFRGDAENLYRRLLSDVGDTIVITSGIRGVLKQTHLFMAKVLQFKGNLSKASQNIAPPGHSYHSVGDFDVGKAGFGRKNFTEAFAETEEFQRLVHLGYVDIRYAEKNHDGVRYEPWHIKVV